MKPVFAAAKAAEPKRIIFSDGEDERVMRAAQVLIEEGVSRPILIGRPNVLEIRMKRYGLRMRPQEDFEIINPESDSRFREYVDEYLAFVARKGVTPERARTIVRTNTTVIGALAVKRGDADALLCGVEGRFERHLRDIGNIIGKHENVRDFSSLGLLISNRGATFFADTHVTYSPTAEEIAETTIQSARAISRFGMSTKAALVSHSNFGSRDSESSARMRDALAIIRERMPDLEVDGEMHGDTAISDVLRHREMPNSTLSGEANLLIFPSLDAAHITMTVVQSMLDALHVGPILLGSALPAHILSPSVTSRGIVNMATLAVVEANIAQEERRTAG
nr:phosphate acyltransferase [Marinicella sp. W31]MDC2878454.1 phosphate acyltransferase [Marinicella sp. W31]